MGDRILSTPDFVNKFYSLITDFYEYGWGESFHFAAREIGESFEASIIRQETGANIPIPSPHSWLLFPFLCCSRYEL